MSVDMIRAAWAGELEPRAKLVLLALADHANSEGICWPSVALLGTKTGLSRRQIQRHLKALRDCGEIEVVERERGWRTRRYYLKGCQQRHLGATPAAPQNGPRGVTGDMSGATRATSPNSNHQPNHQGTSNRQRNRDPQALWMEKRYEAGKRGSIDAKGW